MTEPIEKKILWAHLRESDRERMLETMIAGIHVRFDEMIKTVTHQAFLMSLHNGEAFDPAAIWDRLPVNSQNHFEHARKAIETMERMLDGDPAPIAQPKKAEPKKVATKKKGK